MKKLIATAVCAVALSASADRWTDSITNRAEEVGLEYGLRSELSYLIGNYDAAKEALREFVYLNGIQPVAKRIMTAKTEDTTDPEIKSIAKIANEQRNRFEVLKKTIRKYDPNRTNIVVRAARQSMQDKLNAERTKALDCLAKLSAETNRIARVTAFLEDKKSESRLSTTKAIYQSVIDKLNEL